MRVVKDVRIEFVDGCPANDPDLYVTLTYANTMGIRGTLLVAIACMGASWLAYAWVAPANVPTRVDHGLQDNDINRSPAVRHPIHDRTTDALLMPRHAPGGACAIAYATFGQRDDTRAAMRAQRVRRATGGEPTTTPRPGGEPAPTPPAPTPPYPPLAGPSRISEA
jgi:hypothetical protein